MITLLLPTGPRLVHDLSPAFAAPPDLAEIVAISRPGPPLFFDQPLARVQMSFRTRTGAGFMVSPLRAVSVLAGKVIVEVLGKWVIGEVKRG